MVSVEAKRLNLLTVNNLSISSMDKILVNNFSFSVEESEIVGMVGESGSGKSICCYSFLNLLPPSLKIGGKLFWKGHQIDGEKEKIALRGHEISFVFQ
jgi:ABC-type glutathione transport system ATPase component